VPKGVEVMLVMPRFSIKGPLGTLKQFVLPAVKVERDGDSLHCRAIPGLPNGGAMSGTMRALVNNMVTGVTKVLKRN